MSVNMPVTEWRRTSGNGELGNTSDTLVTLNDLQLITLSGEDIITLEGTYTPIPQTIWDTVEPTPTTVWLTTPIETENVFDGPNDLVDTLGNNIVDTDGNQIVDTGITMDLPPDTIWEEDDSI